MSQDNVAWSFNIIKFSVVYYILEYRLDFLSNKLNLSFTCVFIIQFRTEKFFFNVIR